MEASVPMCLAVALGGISFCGSDVGGFFGNPSAELMVRWFQIGAYSPFFRSHSHIETARREPWVYGEETLVLIREAIRERYRLLPFWYTLFYDYSVIGTPVIQPMFLQYPEDSFAYSLDKQYFLGDALMIVTISQPLQQFVNVYIPDGRWFDFHGYQEIENRGVYNYLLKKEWIPVLLKGGSIVPTQDRPRRSSFFMKNDPYSLVIALDYNGMATGRLFVDDGKSFNYQKGEFLETFFEFKDNNLKNRVLHDWTANNTIEKIVVLGLQNEPAHVLVTAGNCEDEHLGFYVQEKVVTIKLPKVKINESWTISLVYH